ncbi:PREDICTED: macrophage mannose receptor 1-like [Acanthisitta chloris]|uniref:macrophage mannose receptor 1-like n=1 Tax=Acanthisitta chloris TaxID=57068 RepID=UPI0004F0C9E1|nr:PREDICTED: macrophage mannose receptor 1-like [Acanthisitta chloris]
MSAYLPLILVLSFSTSLQVSGSGIFSIYNEDSKLCAQAQNSSSIITTTCNEHDEFQKFRWVSAKQLLSVALKLCLGVLTKNDDAAVTLESCNRTNELQWWECRNETFATYGKELFLSYGKGKGKKIRLSEGSGKGSRWKIHGTTDSVCLQRYEDIYTLGGNAFGAPCMFPFKFKGKWYADCIPRSHDSGSLWCATTSDFDKDQMFGNCPLKDTNNNDLWKTNPMTGIQYQINSQSLLTWHQARKSCQQQNAELISVTDLHEEMYLLGLTSDLGVNVKLWTGLYSTLNSGWQWTGGSPFRYLNWAPGNPSVESGKICGTFQGRNGKWENQACDRKLGYICQKRNTSLDTFTIASGDLKPVKCPRGWVPYAGHCYRIYRTPKIWKEAQSACRKEDGELASIHNIEEYSFTVSQLGYKPDDELWIGLNDFKVRMYFEWSDGTPVTYTKWHYGEPAHTSDKADCIVMKGEDGSWADSTCEMKLGYICKRKPLAEGSGATQVDYIGCQKGWMKHGFYCYSVGQLPTTFSTAKKICEENKGYLLTVRDRYEQAFLTSVIGFNPAKYFWIGLSDTEDQGTFRWANGDPVTFTHWNVGMPGEQSGCVAMATGTSAGLWDILNCEETNMFLCKQLVEGVTPPPLPPTTPPLLFCPDGWQSVPQSSFCFKIFQGGREKMQTWFGARDFCRTIGGDLACIHNEEEQELIKTLDKYYIHLSYWMGLSALDADSGFTWSDGSPVNFEKWSHGEPNNYHGNEKCGVFNAFYNMRWNDLFCEHMLDYVCQIKKGASLKPEPNSTFTYERVAGEEDWIIYNHKEYYFSSEAMPMEKARDFCKKNGSDLAVIESESEKNFLWKYVFYKEWGHKFYIGLSVSLDKTFQWMDGTPVSYVAWAPNEPNFANNDENCVVMYTQTGTWNDLNCGSVELFICERLNNTVRTTVAPTSPPPKGGCQEDWLLFDNKCFKVFGLDENDTLSWHGARNNCIDLGGNLATISKKEVQAFLMSLLKNAATDAWIGMNDINQEHTYLWTDGSPVDYTNWAKGSRTYYSMNDCFFMVKNPIEQAGKWKDEECKTSKSYICQKNSDPKLQNSQPTVPMFGFHSYGNDRYAVINYKMSWEEAEKNCRDQSADLASILDPYVESYVLLQIIKHGGPVWIGLNSNMSGGQYIWSDKRRSRYHNWASGEPNKNKACVYLDLDGFWRTASCNETFFSLCKQSNDLIPSEPPQLPGKCPEPKRGRSWIPYRGHCYYVHTTSEESWPDASMVCIQMGASLVSIEDSAEMNFLLFYLSPLTNDFRKFWIGLFKNIDGEWMWIDRSEVEYVNWEKGEPTVSFNERCVDMDVSSGTWRTYYCSVDQNFICKTPKIPEVDPTHDSPVNNASKNEAAASSANGLGGIIFILIILLLAGIGFTLYYFYKKRRGQQMITASFDNAIYCGDPGTHESNCLVTNIEENEQATI